MRPPATMPQRPTIEPTDRSMPPVMMTKVMPIARKALSATCFDIRMRLAADRKVGTVSAKNSTTAINAMKVRAFISVSSSEPPPAGASDTVAASAILVAPCRRRPVSLGRGCDDRRLARLRPVEHAGQLAVAHHRDPIGQGQHLVEVRGGKQDPQPVARQLAHGAEHIGLGPDVDAAAR